MLAVLIRTIKDRWRALLAYTLIGAGSQWMYISLYPTFQKSMADYDAVFKNMPEAFMKIINLDNFSMNTLEKYLTMEMYSMFWLILTILLTISLAGQAFAGDIERETIVQTASQPISRKKIFMGKAFAGAAIFTVFNILVNAVVFPLASLYNISYDAAHFVTIFVMGELFGLTLLSVALCLSAWAFERGRVVMIMSGLVLVMYVMNIVAGITTSLDKLKYFSFFHYFNPGQALIHGQYNGTSIGLFFAVIAVTIGVGFWKFVKRDIA